MVALAIKAALGLAGDPSAEHRLFQLNSGWARCERTLDVVRFSPTLICHPCNLIDGLYLGTKPGPHFSLTPDEIKAIRVTAGHNNNGGTKFENALRKVRMAASADYRHRSNRADKLGASYAAEWLADSTIQAALATTSAPRQS